MLKGFLLSGLVTSLVAAVLPGSSPKQAAIIENNFDKLTFSPYVERDFPFISTYLDARNLGPGFPDDNVVARGLIVNLDDSAFVCFDRDLLRWSVAWSGAHLTESMLPQVSYSDFFNKKNTVPLVAGKPAIANGIYPGWSRGAPISNDIRPESQRRAGFTWGALPEAYGRWQGCYVYNNRVVLSYRISETDIRELPGVIREQNEAIFTRTLEVCSSADALFLNLAEVRGGREALADGSFGYVHTGEKEDSVVAATITDETPGTKASLVITDNRYLSVMFPPSRDKRSVTVCVWKGEVGNIDLFRRASANSDIALPPFQEGGTERWAGKVITKGKIAPDTSAFVTDLLTLPVPNPWKRNVRVTDLAFLSPGKAVVTTFEGDVWMVEGIDSGLENLSWRRFASGLYEPMSVAVYHGQIYVFGKEGIVRLHDLNSDGEADYYENFSDVMQQSAESYEWAADMIFSEKNDGIIIAKGGAVAARPGITKTTAPGFRAGSNHSGVIMKISLDGRQGKVLGTGLRAPFLGVHPETGVITATDQQGNYVSTTPVYVVDDGDFFGVPTTSHRSDNPPPKRPLIWIPHRIDRSAGSEIWMTGGKMGPLNNALIHFSFGKPGLFRVLIDSASSEPQGAVVPIHSEYTTPVIKGAVGPADGQLYMAGFNLFGSSSKGISAIQRLRYTGKKSDMPGGIRAGAQGVMIRFDSELDGKDVANTANFRVKRWNYRRTSQYGSGHFKLDGTPGEEILPVLASYLSTDGRDVLLLIPDMQRVDQMEILYQIKDRQGKSLSDGIWLSVNSPSDMKAILRDFKDVDLGKLQISRHEMDSLIKSDPPITRERGRELFLTMGCVGCHSPGTETAGMNGPPFKGLYGSEREMADGSVVLADDAYLKESILRPEAKTVKGYEAAMPSFEGILGDPDIEALLLYIMYLKY